MPDKAYYLKEIRPAQTVYRDALAMWLEAFPTNERRDENLQEKFLQEKDTFTAHALYREGMSEMLGAVYLWRFPTFIYIEHLFTDSRLRNRGLGTVLLEYLMKDEQLPFVLEAELPDTPLSLRRIGFYERNGFRVCPQTYTQPPYRAGEKPLPMHLLTNQPDAVLPCFEEVVRTIYKEVYGVS